MQVRDQRVGHLVFVHLTGATEGGRLEPDLHAVKAAVAQFLDDEQHIGFGDALRTFREDRLAFRRICAAAQVVDELRDGEYVFLCGETDKPVSDQDDALDRLIDDELLGSGTARH
ncbi:hypothetical protein [Streptomyces sp. Isolate_45]|uniref:hypothetical protein n=1 Tax=Streptomyces sp. Isolate_45 TaxID=2950111 RepID=UPI002481E818|nr:hypothetical protein [Streptomyces sp. Isolate_45]MDA5279981.1 hypothetical protein [Streptomyces sp. Isolate_45]